MQVAPFCMARIYVDMKIAMLSQLLMLKEPCQTPAVVINLTGGFPFQGSAMLYLCNSFIFIVLPVARVSKQLILIIPPPRVTTSKETDNEQVTGWKVAQGDFKGADSIPFGSHDKTIQLELTFLFPLSFRVSQRLHFYPGTDVKPARACAFDLPSFDSVATDQCLN